MDNGESLENLIGMFVEDSLMKKVWIAGGAVVLVVVLVATAFVSGLALGKFGQQNAILPTIQLTSAPDQGQGDTGEETPEQPGEGSPTPMPIEGKPTDSTPEGGADGCTGSAAIDFDYEILNTVLDLLDEQFYGEIPDEKTLAYGAIRGMLMTLDDQYTSFIDPEITAILNEDASGLYEGIGAFVNMNSDGFLEIVSLIPGQPAEAAGVLPGDIVLAVGDQSLVGLGLYEAISYIRGPAGTEAELEIARVDEPESIFITVTRASIEIPIVEYEILDDGIAYIKLTEFDANATDSVNDALSELLQDEPQALIFDLRDNPGGWLNQAIGVADIFLDSGVVVIQRDSQGNERVFESQNGDDGEEIPMVVLVNRGSASASEIVAGALQDRDRAVLIGKTTLGKGSVQVPNDLYDGSQLRVTIARWFTPNEQEIHGNGLTPDIEVEFPLDTPEGEDPQLDRAIEYILQGQ
jgi:carboxyl-terminal processing protease